MIHRTASAIVCTVLASTVVAPAFAWGPVGHMIVAEIAWRELSPATRTAIQELMADNPAGSAIQMTASWADAVRPMDEYSWSAPLHYTNMAPDAAEYDYARDCPDEGCVVLAIQRFRDEIRNTALPIERRREALMFLVHFVGDMHQPLHGGRAEDRGGNDIEITFFDRETNLHRIWDSQILEAYDSASWIEMANKLYPDIDAMDRVAWLADFHRDDMIATSGRWAYESHSLAELYCYGMVAKGDSVGAEYVEETIPVVKTRLSQGGVRLAAVLETAFAPAEPAADDVAEINADADASE